MKPRGGWSLIEVSVTVSLTSVLLAGTAVLLTMLMRSEGQLRGDLRQRQMAARLSRQFREDAHAADTAEIADDCRLTRADGSIVIYTWQPPRLLREVRQGEEPPHRDHFLLPEQAEVEFSLAKLGERQMAHLRVTAADAPPRRYATPVRPLAIEALVGLHRRNAEATP